LVDFNVFFVHVNRLFELEPSTKKVFHLDVDMKISGMQKMAVLIHGHRIVHMLDSVLSMLGPDMDTVEEILTQLGERHRRYGVKAEYIPLLGQAIRESLKEVIGSEWTDSVHTSWVAVYEAISAILLKALE
jgi:hemoglobin-like flavoprotein